ncbi:hypothetical protein ACTVNK_19355, partial [Serratia nevei]
RSSRRRSRSDLNRITPGAQRLRPFFYPHCAPRRILLSPFVAIGKTLRSLPQGLRMRLYRLVTALKLAA